ncbi:magnesium transporter [Bremerella sp. T1]|uniref:magnesium transporter n=1 Tax=Bremerella sp. TYQ1 TaxID=3119568 RepID=UPI001CC97970|nr:magnesium transporter [Bremerella volcania]UBM37261.1 magnesium transporter [Bremerella volcania]
MINTLYLPELREMLSEHDSDGLREFCTALHPARTAEFMEGLTPEEAWGVLDHADLSLQGEILSYFDYHRQAEMLEARPPQSVAPVVATMSADDQVDLLGEVEEETAEQILACFSADDRRDVLRLSNYAEGTAGAIMTTEMARLSETLTAKEALAELTNQAEHLETIYYLYVVDDFGSLHGVVSTRDIVSALSKPQKKLSEIMETEVIHANVLDDQEEVLRKMADYDLLAIPVVDEELRLVGIITHDDILDVVVEEAAEDAYRAAAVEPLEETYLRTSVLTLSRKRGVWLAVLFVGAFMTTFALEQFEADLARIPWLVIFIPLVISTGGNSGNQSATLVITALNKGEASIGDWWTIMRRELAMGLILGLIMAFMGLLLALFKSPSAYSALVVPATLVLVVMAGTLIGSMLPLMFKKIGLDPALMSNPFVAGLIDLLGIVIYLKVALLLLE